jgi:hydrogenase 3 maturation protease
MGLGNVDYGDDGFGVRLAEKLIEAGMPDVLVGGTSPDRCLGCVVEGRFDQLVFLDAIEFGGTPGSVVLLNTEEIVARLPQVSTHHISLGLLARCVEANGNTRVRLLGVQPESLKRAEVLTPKVQTTLDALGELLGSLETAAMYRGAGVES